MALDSSIIDYHDPILITGSNGFIGSRVVESLLSYGFKNLKCFVRPSSNLSRLNRIIDAFDNINAEIIRGNLLSPENCDYATKEVKVVYHLAAGVEKSFPGCFQNSVVATKNLLESIRRNESFKRFLNVSSFFAGFLSNA